MISEVLPNPVDMVGYGHIPFSLVGWDGIWNEEDSGMGWRHLAGI